MRRREWIVGGIAALGAFGSARAQEPAREGWDARDALEGREPIDPNALTAEEASHAPVLMLPAVVRAGRPFDLVVQIGTEPHPMSASHRVRWIEVAVDRERTFVADLGPSVAYPIVRLSIVLARTSTLTVRSRCSLHETWRTRRVVEVR